MLEPRRLWLAALLAASTALGAGCGDDDNDSGSGDGGLLSDEDTGTLVVTVSPSDAMVVVEGPEDYMQEFDGSETLTDLEPGEYTASADADGYVSETDSVTVVAGQASSVSFNLRATSGNGMVGPDGGMVGADGGLPDATTGTLVISASPPSASVRVTGPDDFEQTVEGSETLTDLEPGDYTAQASADGYGSQSDTVSVRAGRLSIVRFDLKSRAASRASRVAYRGANGQLHEIERDEIDVDRFVFYAWLRDLDDEGIDPGADLPGAPSASEQHEIAPSHTQNLAMAWVGYVDGGGDVWPISGADVRWRIDRQFPDALNSVHFGSADDNARSDGFSGGVDNDQADTRTNNASVDNAPFPLDSEYPLYNRTGVITPDTDGATWVTLFSPDPRARARVTAVASVAGVEISKAVLVKEFAPAARIVVDKSVDNDQVDLGLPGTGQASFTVTVQNVGDADASEVVLSDRLYSGDSDGYEIMVGNLPGGASGVDSDGDNAGTLEGFDLTFALAAGESRELTFTSDLSAPDTFCNRAQVTSYTDEFRTREPAGLMAQACLTAVAPELQVIKDFVDADGNSLGNRVTVGADQAATLRVRVLNEGGAQASAVSVADALTEVDGSSSSGDNADYEIASLPDGASGNGEDGFTLDLGDLAAGESAEATFEVSAGADGVYCDTATLSADGSTVGQDDACLEVATPVIELEKTNSKDTVVPGETYASLIGASNTGSATAIDLVVFDLLGYNAESDTRVSLVSSTSDDLSGFVEDDEVSSPSPMGLGAGEAVLLQVVSRVPNGAPAGEYCDTGRYTSENAGSGEQRACVTVPAFAALQTQLIEDDDPLRPGESTRFTSVLLNEPRSNETVRDNVLTFSFGTEDAAQNGNAGELQQTGVAIYRDTDPQRDSSTGLVTSGPSNDTATRLREGDDYELTTDEQGLQVIDLADDLTLAHGEALYVVHTVQAPDDIAPGDYSTNYTWKAVGSQSGDDFDAVSAELTTVIE